MEKLLALDEALLRPLNEWMGRSPGIWKLAHETAAAGEFLIATAIALLWFWRDEKGRFAYRPRMLLLFAALAASYLLARVLQGLVRRPRPLIQLSLAYGAFTRDAAGGLIQLGSFPSDHAMLYFVFATVVFGIDLRAGLAAAALALILCAFRVGVGLHWPGDIVGGALLGVAMGVLALAAGTRLRRPLQWAVDKFDERPALAYGVGFLLLADLAQSFKFAKAMFHLLDVRLFH